jgi:hypothetical protein
MSAAPAPTMDRATAQAAAKKASAIFDEPANAETVKKVMEAAAGDMGKFFMMVIPAVIGVLAPVLTEYGYTPDQPGALMFAAELEKHSAEDPEINAAKNALKARFMPNMSMPKPAAPPADEGLD